MHPLRAASLALVTLVAGVALLLAPATARPAAGQEETPDLKIVQQNFGWVSADEEAGTARYAWRADVANNEGDDYQVVVVLELLDDNDEVQHTDHVSATLKAGDTETIQDDGTCTIEVAKTIVSYRNSLRLLTNQ